MKHLLNDRAVKNAKPKAAPYRIPDGENLYLYISTSGVKSWQFRYRLNGTPHTYTVGKYPKVSVESAREQADSARTHVAAGHHLTIRKRTARLARIHEQASNFGAVRAAWLVDEGKRKGWAAEYRDEVDASLNRHLSTIDSLPIADVRAKVVAPLLRALQRKAPMMLDKVHRRLRGIMDYAVEEGLIPSNPLPNRRPHVAKRHYPAVTNLPGVAAILREARAADPCKGIQRAHLLLAFTAMRVSEVVEARWPEFDLKSGNWSIPRERMKRKDESRGPHVVPLPPALLASIKEWRAADGPEAVYVCVAPRDEKAPITPEGIEKFYRSTMGLVGKHSPHSWRSAFSTICRELGKEGDVIEAQLDHVVGSKIASAYDRAKRLELRRELMEWYEDTLIAARDGATVVPMRAKK